MFVFESMIFIYLIQIQVSKDIYLAQPDPGSGRGMLNFKGVPVRTICLGIDTG